MGLTGFNNTTKIWTGPQRYGRKGVECGELRLRWKTSGSRGPDSFLTSQKCAGEEKKKH